jgi:predicted MFS family arabinose efflux permease
VGQPGVAVVAGLAVFGVVFAMNSSIHSYMILAYSDAEAVSLNVGFYYMANAAGRLVGTLLSGGMFMLGGMQACLWTATALVAAAALVSSRLPAPPRREPAMDASR